MIPDTIKVTFSDLMQREAEGKRKLDLTFGELDEQVKKGDTSVEERLAAVTELRDESRYDPLFYAVHNDVYPSAARIHAGRYIGSDGNPRNPKDRRELEIVSVLGLLLADGVRIDEPARATELADDLKFNRSLAQARGEFRARTGLFEKVFEALAEEGKTSDPGGHGESTTLKAIDLATVTRELASRGITTEDGYLPIYARSAFSNLTGHTDEAAPSTIRIELPDLEAEVDVEIAVDNLDAMQALYFSSTLEDLKLFLVMDKIVELFHQGMLPLGKGSAGNQLYGYWKKSNDRLTEVERRNLYSRAFGFPGGDASTGTPNREFLDLWYRFVSGVSEYNRQSMVEQLLRDRSPLVVNAEQVRKSGRDLAANLSLYGYGVAYFAATELQTQIKEILKVLGDDEMRSAYGARDVWQVVDQVATLELGGARNGVRQRTMATAGATIIRWLARNIDKLASIGHGPFLDPKPNPYNPAHRPMVDPTDRDMIDACEQWLAVTGTSDQSIEEYAQPVEGPNMTSRPIQIPRGWATGEEMAKDLLDSANVSPLQYNQRRS